MTALFDNVFCGLCDVQVDPLYGTDGRSCWWLSDVSNDNKPVAGDYLLDYTVDYNKNEKHLKRMYYRVTKVTDKRVYIDALGADGLLKSVALNWHKRMGYNHQLTLENVKRRFVFRWFVKADEFASFHSPARHSCDHPDMKEKED